MDKVTPQRLREMKQRGAKIAVLTAYDFATTKLLDEAGIPVVLVGDSLGMVVLGYDNTRSVTMDDMLHHIRAVARAQPRGLIVGDMPIRSYDTVTDALRNAQRFMEAGAEAVKLEGCEAVIDQVRALIAAGIPVLGHIGLLPQSISDKNGYRVQGRTAESAEQLVRDAKALEAAGAFAVVIECTVASVAGDITRALKIPTIGIGAGPDCDGQVLVSNDMLGQFTWFTPKHVKRYAKLADEMRQAFAAYKRDVESGEFPGKEQSFT